MLKKASNDFGRNAKYFKAFYDSWKKNNFPEDKLKDIKVAALLGGG